MNAYLTPLQHDALCEIFNISVGRAAAALSGLVGETVSLTVPAMRFCTVDALSERMGMAEWQRVDAISQPFRGSFEGDALLMFPDDDGMEVVKLMLARLKPLVDIDALASDALVEIGNLLLNACLSALADILTEAFDFETPSLSSGRAVDILGYQGRHPHDPVLFLHIQFSLESRRIEGFLAFLINLPSLDHLRKGIDRFIAKLGKTE